MFYILYQVTNVINGRIYVGVHKTKNLDDGYMGSGKIIRRAVEKYGLENFSRVILEQFDNAADMFAREKEVVTDEFLLRDDTYNLRRGGTGGFDYINQQGIGGFGGRKHSLEARAKQGHEFSDEERESVARRMRGNRYNPKMSVKGKDHPAAGEKSVEHLAKIATAISELHKEGRYNNSPIHKSGEGHPQFGTMWITDGLQNKKISNSVIPEGWRRGRVLNKRV